MILAKKMHLSYNKNKNERREISMKKSVKVITLLLALIVVAALVVAGGLYANKQREAAVLLPVRTMVSYMFFDTEEYDHYAAVFQERSRVGTEEEIDRFKQNRDVQRYFPGDMTVEEVMSHMKIEYKDRQTATVSWQREKNGEPSSKWSLVQVNGQWLIKN
jgi:uncharacterized ion transporter superfamily protein YfcC